jgi:hypothetical protein
MFLALWLVSCGYGNIDSVKEHADSIFEANGFKVVGYLGYQWSNWIPFTTYGGALVYYRLDKIPNNGLTYRGAIQKWGKEYHIYDIKSYDAIRPR